MKLQTQRCIVCGFPELRDNYVDDPYDHLDVGGNFLDTDFWFCSTNCFEHLIDTYIPDKNYHRDVEDQAKRTIIPYDECPKLQDVIRFWQYRRERCIREALKSIRKILLAEQAAFDRAVQVKEAAEMQKERKREEEKQRQIAEAEAKRIAGEQAYQTLIAPKFIPNNLWFEHCHILAPSRAGKTSLLQELVLGDYYDFVNNQWKDPPANLIIDPKGLMIERLARLCMFTTHLRDRIVIVDPFDAPALNMFDACGQNPAQIAAHFSYIFSSTNLKLTGQQELCFSFCVMLLFRI